MTQQVDLNEVRNRVITNRQQDVDLPRSPRQAVYVDNGGNIVTDPEPSGHRHLSQVPQKIFAASLMQDRQVVVRKLPPNAQEMNISGVTGWVYEITSELGDHYTMFIFNDGSLYQVMVLFPEVAGRIALLRGICSPTAAFVSTRNTAIDRSNKPTPNLSFGQPVLVFMPAPEISRYNKH